MTSFAQQLGWSEPELRRRSLSLAAYALSVGSRVFDFPATDLVSAEPGSYPIPVSEDQLHAEAATVMLGSAGAAMALDQQIGLALTSVAAGEYWRAGHYYGLFLWACLRVPFESLATVVSDLTEHGPADNTQYPEVLVPEQIAYLAAASAVRGDSSVATYLFNLVPPATPIGPYALPLPLLQGAFAADVDTQQSARDVVQYLLASFEISSRSMQAQPQHRRLLPWNVGVPPEVLLMIATLIARSPALLENPVILGSYSSALWGASVEASVILRRPDLFRDVHVSDILEPWLESDQQGNGY